MNVKRSVIPYKVIVPQCLVAVSLSGGVFMWLAFYHAGVQSSAVDPAVEQSSLTQALAVTHDVSTI